MPPFDQQEAEKLGPLPADQKRQKAIIGQTRLLIVDSEPAVGEALRRFLVSQRAPAAYVATTSLLALRVLQDRKTPVDCVICAQKALSTVES